MSAPPGNERSGPDTTPDRLNAQQTAAPATTANTVHGTASGLAQAIDNADPWWMAGALLLIAQTASATRYVCACDIADNDLLGDPDHSGRYGAAFNLSATAGVITYVAHHRARRASRHSGVHSVWRAA